MARPPWYNDNRNRSFPFLKGSVGIAVPDSGPVTMRQLPDDFIVDCGFIMGPESGFIEGEHKVFLRKIYRVGDDIYFEFGSSAPLLAGEYLTFVRTIGEEVYATEFVEAVPPPITLSTSASASESEVEFCPEFLWEGYLITGILESIAVRLADGETIARAAGDSITEPALIQNLNNGMLVSLELANSDRTRVSAPEECPDVTWPHQTGIIFIAGRCLQGDIRLKEGFNTTISQNVSNNSITIGATVNAGAGEPCAEVPLFPGESPPDGSTNNLLSGGPLCNETLRSINGIGGPQFTIFGGTGVSVIPDPDINCITIDVNLVDLALCISDFSAVSESI
jgi:hypothetical protein